MFRDAQQYPLKNKCASHEWTFSLNIQAKDTETKKKLHIDICLTFHVSYRAHKLLETLLSTEAGIFNDHRNTNNVQIFKQLFCQFHLSTEK